ncbi:protein Mis18-beta [Callorhinchus milii]|uniref:Protein Mis18-beta-like protein n=2 Tax=Callorhinchus milii TaxID=7868 RepID=V9L907_CALMI|nr:protein Mis18-beta [Callorhinchus milii]|eukprot:gi/632983859/ref/XP_007908855.1/ PREDICTED: protein Mis18-beta [Callorhinchus milii]
MQLLINGHSVPDRSGFPEAPAGMLKLEHCVIFQCRNCNTVLADSVQYCGSNSSFNVLVFLDVSDQLALDPHILVGSVDPTCECLHRTLSCCKCEKAVGFVAVCTASSLAHLRGLYCLFKQSLHCYVLQSNSMVEVSDLNLECPSVTQMLGELKKEIVVAHCRLMAAVKKLDELAGEDSGLASNMLDQGQGQQPPGAARR